MTADTLHDAAVRQAWQRIEHWHVQHGRARFNPSADGRALGRLAAHLGRALPAALRTLLGLHDGGAEGYYALPMRMTEPTCWRLLPAAEIEAEAQRLAAVADALPTALPVRATGPVEARWWSAGWVPIAEDGSGDRLCFDLAPPAGGTEGQLVLYAHDTPERRVLQPSLAAWLQEAAHDLEAGRYRHELGVGLIRT